MSSRPSATGSRSPKRRSPLPEARRPTESSRWAGPIDETQVRHIAKLSQLNLSADDIRLFSGQLASILKYFQQLQAVDSEGGEPLAHPLAVTNVLRADEPPECFDTSAALSNAPERAGPFFRVPQVLHPSPGT